MIITSPEYRAAITSDSRKVFGRVTVDYSDPFMPDEATVPEPQIFPNISILASDAVDFNTLHEVGDGRVISQQGWRTNWVSGTGGAFTVPPVLTYYWAEQMPRMRGLRVAGNPGSGQFPVDFTWRLYEDDFTHIQRDEINVRDNTLMDWTHTGSWTNIKRMELIIWRWSHVGQPVHIVEAFPQISETYDDSTLVLCDLLEERELTLGGLPVGNVSANEISIQLDNLHRRFDAGNRNSPLYGLLRPGRRIRAWLGAGTPIQWIPLGVFWSGEWHASAADLFAQTTGRDRLDLLTLTTYTTSVIRHNVSLRTLAIDVLTDAGLSPTEYWVDPALDSIMVPVAWFEPTSHREALRQIAEASLGQVYCDRFGVIRVEGVSWVLGQESFVGPGQVGAQVTSITSDNFTHMDAPIKWGELANVIDVETMPLVPTSYTETIQGEFKRASNARHPVSAALLAPDQPRYLVSRWGHGMQMEVGVTNRLTDNQSSAEIDLTGFGSWGASGAVALGRMSDRRWHSGHSVRITSQFAGTQNMGINTTPIRTPVALDDTIIGSAYGRYVAGRTMFLVIHWWTSANVWISQTNGEFVIADGTFQRCFVLGFPPANAASCSIELRFTNALNGDQGWVDGLMIEREVFNNGPTTWVQGGVTRATEECSYNMLAPLPQNFMATIWLRPDWSEVMNGEWNMDGAWHWVLSFYDQERSETDFIDLFYDARNVAWVLRKAVGGAAEHVLFSDAHSVARGVWLGLAIRQTPMGMGLSIRRDGAAVTHIWNTNTVVFSPTLSRAYLGVPRESAHGGDTGPGGVIDSLSVREGVFSAASAAAALNATQPPVLDHRTMLLTNMNGSLGAIVGQRIQEVYRDQGPETIGAGQTLTRVIFFDKQPVEEISATLENPATGVTITTLVPYSWGAYVTIRSTAGASSTYTLVAHGQVYEVLSRNRITVQNTAGISRDGMRRYRYPDNHLVQTATHAQWIADILLRLYGQLHRGLVLDWRGDPSMLLGAIIQVKDNDTWLRYWTTKQTLQYDGTLSATAEGRLIQ